MLQPEAVERYHRQQQRFHEPSQGIEEDLMAIYERNEFVAGMPHHATRLFDALAREHTVAVIGVALGDEGKGRIIDNKLEAILAIPGVERAVVIRFQGGSNSGHSLEKGDIKFAVHQVPSGVLFPQAIGLIDRGVVIHPQDLATEVTYVEEKVGDLRGKLFLSEEAILVTDLERAEEALNKIKQGKAAGGTGRGIGPAYAHHYDRLGLNIHDLLSDSWRETLGKQYQYYEKEFAAFGMGLSQMQVPDFEQTKKTGTSQTRTVGTQEEFLDRLETARIWLLERNIVTNLFAFHKEIYEDLRYGILFEGAQAVGLHAWLGTRPDVTASDTSVYGVGAGTGYWRAADIADRIGVFKIPYTSSVGARHMPTEVPLPKNLADLPTDQTSDQKWAAYIRDQAHEYGTSTGRPRDILSLDLAMLTYNCRMAGIEVLAGTHLDISREGESIKVCTHYTDQKGNYIPYQPGLRYQEGVVPQYIKLPGWDGEAARQATNFEELPENAKKFLAFIQTRTGYPIIAATTGPSREHLVTFQGY